MYSKKLCVAIIVLLVFQEFTEGRKSRRNPRPKAIEDTTLQPSVVSYSTFGFNDVGSFDGFVPTSPDYANYLTNINQETSTRLYAPAFPTALDNTGFSSNSDSQSDGQYFTSSDHGILQSSMVEYPKNIHFYNTPSFDENSNKNFIAKGTFRGVSEENDSPVYGTKLGSKSKKMLNQFNDTEFNIYTSAVISPSDLSSNFNFHYGQGISENKPSFGESPNNYHINPGNIGSRPIDQSTNLDDFDKPEASSSHGSLKFPKVIDFTKMSYPVEIGNKYISGSFNSNKNSDKDNSKNEQEVKYSEQINKFTHSAPMFKDSQTYTRNHEKNIEKHTSFNQDFSDNYANSSPVKTNFKEIISEQKNKMKYFKGNFSTEDKALNPQKGYEYSTNFSNTSFKFDFVEPKKPFSTDTDEVIPASSNVVDLAHYQFPEIDYTRFKKIPDIKTHYDYDYNNALSQTNKIKPTEDLNYFKNLHGSLPASTTNWGNVFKSTDYTTYKNHARKPVQLDDITSDIVHIPKRPHSSKYSNNKDIEYTSNDLSNSKIKSYNSKLKLGKEWNSDMYNYRYKTEEDLLGLRNHDTSHPSYLPTFRPNANELSDDNEYYKKLVEKWRQSYWKSKFKNSYPDYESYSTETKPVHVPIPKPYPVQVPVMQPYPVHIPHVRPVFHHSRPPREEFESDVRNEDDDDYFPRPEGNKKTYPYKKKPRSTRNRTHRPTRTTYSTAKKRPRRPADYRTRRPSSTHVDFHYSAPYRHSDYDQEQFDETSDYYSYCKRTGNC
ncbi:uncharacterized protein LOC131852915 isoform X2 [Achroia grisella]|uniref:uncharacterized protein LOC131852915 isoform X2 n=1 Tax=Achroia grisella TaxID=688607 RepID=UPI0027D310A7|nr:uncharacterized protein LOC131852915 isoform X2 [Achroia grisella]